MATRPILNAIDMELSMFRTIGTACVVVAIGTLAIAWSHRSERTTIPSAGTIVPSELQVNVSSLPHQEFNDLTFVYVNEN